MKKVVLFVSCLLVGISGFSQNDTTSAQTIETALSKADSRRLQGKPVLETFGLSSGNIGFALDSAFMTRNFDFLLKTVELLDSLEQLHHLKSPYIEAKFLMDTTASLLVSQVQTELSSAGWQKVKELAEKFQVDAEVRSRLDRQRLYASHQRLNTRMERRAAFRAKGNTSTSHAPAASARPSGPLLNVVNNSSRNLYLYVEDEYKGIVYPGKEFQLRGRPGCRQVIAESLDQFRSARKYCFNAQQASDWVIANER